MRVLLVCAAVLAMSAQTFKEQGLDHYKRREFAAAAAAFERHVQANPGDTAARLLLGLSYQQSGDLALAVAAFRQAPRRADSRFYLARVLYEMGRFAEAEESARDSEKLGYSKTRVALLLGLVRLETARFEEALSFFESAKKTAEARDAEPWAQAGRLLLKLNRPAEAIASLEEAERRGARDAGTLLDRARRLLVEVREHKAAKAPAKVVFENRIDQSGVGFILRHHPAPEKYLPETMAGGVAVFDFDGDGLPDLYFANGAPLPGGVKRDARDWNGLYRNLGGFKFEDVTERAGVRGEGFSIGVAAADFDRDGRPDLFVGGVGRHHLYRNIDGRRFEDAAQRAGLVQGEWVVGGAWLDYDRDGWLDLFVVNYVVWDPAREPYCGDAARKFRVYCHPKNYAPLANRLYRNRGNGTFEDVSAKSGIGGHRGKGMSAAVADYDRDGYSDIFVPNDTLPNFLFRNRGDGTFEETALAAGVALTGDGQPVSGMGSDFRDADNDGWPDIVFTALTGETFPMFTNLGARAKGQFEDRTYPSGLGVLTARTSGWGVGLADFNNDGWKDLFVAASHVTDNLAAFSESKYEQPNHVLLNGGGRFFDGGVVGNAAAHRGLAIADLDLDGRLDAVVTVLDGKPELWHNVTEPRGNYLQVQVEELGAEVAIGNQRNVFTSAGSYASSAMGPVHFGLGEDAEPPEVEVRFPGGEVTRVRAPGINRLVKIRRR